MSLAAFRRGAAAAALALPLVTLSAAPALADDHGHDGHSGSGDSVTVMMNPMKGEDAEGTATLTKTDDGGLRVKIEVSDMVPGQPHAQHIHGDTSGTNFTCPGPERDEDGDGFLTTEEGLPDYGGVFISLTTKGDTSAKSGLAVDRMPVADDDGNLSYERTLDADELPEGTLDNLENLHIVQHGVDANDNDEYDEEGLGVSTFAESLGVEGIPEEATNPATCGMVTPSGGVETGGADQAQLGSAGLVGSGAALLAAAGALFVVRRRVAGSQAS